MVVRYTIVFPNNVASTLEGLAYKKGMNKAEILRRSLAIYDYLHREACSGCKIYIKNDSKKLEKELILEDLIR